MSKARSESNGDVGIDRVKQQQDRLAKELRQELLIIDEKRREVLNRVTSYFRTGLLTAEHVTFIRSKKEVEIPPYKRKKRESDMEMMRVPEATSPGFQPKPCPLSRKAVPSSHSSSGDGASSNSITDDPAHYPAVDENVFCTIRISEDEDSSGDDSLSEYHAPERRSGPQPPAQLFGGAADAEDRLEALKTMLTGWSIKSFPRDCPLCINRFSHKRSLIRHLFGDRSTERVATCPGLTSSAVFPHPIANADAPAQSSSRSKADGHSSTSNEKPPFHSGASADADDQDDFGPDDQF